MNVTRRIAKNSASLGLNTVVRIGLAFFFTLYIGRTLGAEWLGKFAILLAFLSVFQISAVFGIPTLVTRELARDRTSTNRYFCGALVAQAALGIVAGAAMSLAALLLNYPQDTTTMLLVGALSVPLFSLTAAAGAILQAHERMEYNALIETASSILQIIALVSLPLQEVGVVALAAIKVGGMAVNAILYHVVLKRVIGLGRFRLDVSFAWNLLRRAWDLVLLDILETLLFRIDVLVLSKMLPEAGVGVYNAAQQLTKTVSLMAMAYGMAIYPALSRLFQTSPRFFLAAIRKSLQYGILLLLPLALGMNMLANQLITLLYGPRAFEGSILILRILAWYMPVHFAYVVFAKSLVASDQQYRPRQVAFIMLGVNLLTQVALTLWIGAPGAAIACVLTYATGALLNRRHIARSVGMFRARVVLGKPILATLGMGLALWPLRQHSLLLAAPVGIVIYFGLLFLLRAFAPEDVDLVRRVITGRPSTHGSQVETPKPQQPDEDGSP